MAAVSRKVVPKKRALSKREKVSRRVSRVHNAVERKKGERQQKKRKASNIRRKLKEVEDN